MEIVKINKMKLEDVNQVVLLEEEVLGETLGQEMLSEEIKKDVACFLVAKINSHVIGYISSYFILNEGEILNFAVEETYQHQGIGTLLFNKLIEMNPNTLRITLEVAANNLKGQSFYLKNGFEKIGIRKKYYANGQDAIIMKKDLL